ncbi:succinylglutamate desuccinylase [Acinetobacter sp. CIP 102143]|nr:succinylglutamate desuccinylase [Acinetobacter sp. CIP 102143]
MDMLNLLLNQENIEQLSGEVAEFSWEWLAEGVLECTPNIYQQAIVLSCGIHGNETAPIEILNQFVTGIFLGKYKLKQRMLFVLGNPEAIRKGLRYLKNDMNRMFCGAYQKLSSDQETDRAKLLEQLVVNFFKKSQPNTLRYHYDLHTAIRASLLPTFALVPFQTQTQTQAYDSGLINSLKAAELDAVVFHSEVAKTFTHFSSEKCQSASVTLELGSAKPFGQNQLEDFDAIYQVIKAIIEDNPLPKRQKAPIREFTVKSSILKIEDDFTLNLTSEAPNFSIFETGSIIATQGNQKIVAEQTIRILFPNPNVKKGLRAGLILVESHKL